MESEFLEQAMMRIPSLYVLSLGSRKCLILGTQTKYLIYVNLYCFLAITITICNITLGVNIHKLLKDEAISASLLNIIDQKAPGEFF